MTEETRRNWEIRPIETYTNTQSMERVCDLKVGVIIRTRLRAPQHGFCWITITTLAEVLLKFPEKADARLFHYVFESVFD
jgi:hypothetical protein